MVNLNEKENIPIRMEILTKGISKMINLNEMENIPIRVELLKREFGRMINYILER